MSEKQSQHRLDELLVLKGLCESRTQAKALIMAGQVRIKDQIADKASRTYPDDTDIELIKPKPYVSRGGEKLVGFLEQFQIDPTGLDVLDVGASTGGFTDCLLQKGARHATCIDVGHGQLHYKLRTDPRVTNLEKINARHLTLDQLPLASYDLIVVDLSFISLTKVLPSVWPFLKGEGCLIALIKPQFEATAQEASRHRGVIQDEVLRTHIVNSIRAFCLEHLPHASEIGCIPSPIKGTDGNQESLMGFTKHSE